MSRRMSRLREKSAPSSLFLNSTTVWWTCIRNSQQPKARGRISKLWLNPKHFKRRFWPRTTQVATIKTLISRGRRPTRPWLNDRRGWGASHKVCRKFLRVQSPNRKNACARSATWASCSRKRTRSLLATKKVSQSARSQVLGPNLLIESLEFIFGIKIYEKYRWRSTA